MTKQKRLLARDIIAKGCEYFGITEAHVFSKLRNPVICRRRAAIWAVIRDRCRPQHSYPALGRIFGKHHTTIIHWVEQARKGECWIMGEDVYKSFNEWLDKNA